MNVIASDPFVKEAKIVITIPGAQQSISMDIHTTDIKTLLSQSDIITIHIPKADKPVIGKEELSILKKGVILINTARGGVFDEDALIEGLNSGQIGGAGIDVFVGEPSPRADILTHPRISLTPHVGGSTVEAQENVGRELAGLIIGHFAK